MNLTEKLTSAHNAHNTAPTKQTLRDFYNVCREANRTLTGTALRAFVAVKANLAHTLTKV